VVLAIGGSDPTCGAGIQSDVRTLECFCVQPVSVVTAITVQDGRRVQRYEAVAARLVAEQLDCVAAALPIAVVKCGMLGSAGVAEVVSRRMARWRLPLVLDPILAASGGEPLADARASRVVVARLLPLATVVTANLAEAERLAGLPVRNLRDMTTAARAIARLGAEAVVVKGGHLGGEAVDVLWDGRRIRRFSGPRIDHDLHGSGCAFSSALAAGLALHWPLGRSVELAGAHVRTLLAGAVETKTGGWLRCPPRSR
jgi:hydroxymethylpyrimidine/phosphomethylpyrimidine kinase